MTAFSRIRRPARTLHLFSDDSILAAFLADAVLTMPEVQLQRVTLRIGATRLPQIRPPDLVLMDRFAFDALEPGLADLAPGVPLVLITDRIDMGVARRLREAGGIAAIPTSFDRTRFLAALALALADEPFLPATLWLPCLDERLAMAGGAAETGAPLTPRERDVLSELASGKSNKLIAHSLGIAEPTVKMHLANIGKKFNAANRTQLLARAFRQGGLPGAEPAVTAT